jgi:alpha-tubulin suppressor-like RCC1 family protein
MATKTDGTLWAWGNNDRGGLGQNNLTNRSSPVQIPGTNWVTGNVDGMSKHIGNFALKTNGTLWAWGSNEYGALGLNNKIEYSSPVQIPGTTWDGIYANGHNDNAPIFATKTDGTGWAFGSNTEGQLGLNGPVGDNARRSSPVQIPGTNWAQFGSNAYSRTAYGIKTDGTMWVWGRGHYGQLGLNEGGPTRYSSPVQLPGTTWKQVDGDHGGTTLAVKTDGTLWAWGFNQLGGAGHNQSGPGAPKYSSPVQVGTDTDWVRVRHSDEATYAFKQL